MFLRVPGAYNAHPTNFPTPHSAALHPANVHFLPTPKPQRLVCEARYRRYAKRWAPQEGGGSGGFIPKGAFVTSRDHLSSIGDEEGDTN